MVKSLAKFFGRVMDITVNPLEDILVTVGAYQALFCTFQALVDEGDEVGQIVVQSCSVVHYIILYNALIHYKPYIYKL